LGIPKNVNPNVRHLGAEQDISPGSETAR
jgi:hypothetical protein